ncbi:uncharacterized protein BX663DRAFT_511999 [Cokeromyces recurvatus]|uniref:uncharacterized protein n=1 Tax=Cokeromyces recurvatus TaxID=90255 RepID=UPI00221FB6E6|nr:uncharacterized protein BX663DRAFT_511999 [Cokeromyces recurvatus]KAI7902179.1 hypothetical protein BX663DRAFT_511999 [Cokeromyces recurvatus]
MGQRQSTEDSQNQNRNDNNNSNTNNDDGTNTLTTRGRIIRPSARVPIIRENPISRTTPPRRAAATTPNTAFIPVNENQRRDERRWRRAQLRERALNGADTNRTNNITTVSEAIEAAASINRIATSDIATTTTTSISSMSPFSRMIVQVISEAVVSSFRNGSLDSDVAYERTTVSNSHRPVRQQLTMHLSPEVFQQIEPESTEDSFMQFFRLPVIVTSVPTSSATNNNNNTLSTNNQPRSTAINADGESPTISEEEGEITRILMLPVFLYGLRTATTTVNNNTNTNTNNTNNQQQQQQQTNSNNNGSRQGTRSSVRIRERLERERATPTQSETQQEQNQSQRTTANNHNDSSSNNHSSSSSSSSSRTGQWTVYILSGNSVENMINDSPSYEELLELAAMIGPARRPTVSQEAIDNYVPIVKYTQQVKQTIVGNSDGCQVCLNSYQSEDDVRVLACHHGFHKDCIDKWLTEGQNQCPLCREVPIPTNENTTPPSSTN